MNRGFWTLGQNIFHKRLFSLLILLIYGKNTQRRWSIWPRFVMQVRKHWRKDIGSVMWLSVNLAPTILYPLAGELWSQNSPDFISENDQILSLVERVRQAVNYKGILVYDRGGDRRELFKPWTWTQDTSCNYLIRQRGDRHLLYKRKLQGVKDIAISCPTSYSMTVLVFAPSFFTAVWLGTNPKLHILAIHATIAAKRLFGISDFKYYAIADGIKTIFKRIGKGLLYSRNYEEPFLPQMSLR